MPQRHLSEYEMARYILPRLDRLRRFCQKYWNAASLKKQIMGGSKGILKCLLDNFDYFVANVRIMAVCQHQHLFRLFESADSEPADHLDKVAEIMENDLSPADEPGGDDFLASVYNKVLTKLTHDGAKLLRYHELNKAKMDSPGGRMLSNPAEVAAAKEKAAAAIERSPPEVPLLPRSGPVRKRLLARMKLHFSTCIEKLEEHSSSLEEMTVLSYISQVKRNTYRAETCMLEFRNQTLTGGGTKRMELIHAVTTIRFDRARQQELSEDGLFGGWDVPGISKLPPVFQHEWQKGALVMRMRNIRERGGWLSKPNRLKKVSEHQAELFALAEAAVRKAQEAVLEKICKVKGLEKCMVGCGAQLRGLLTGEFPTYELFRTGPDTYDYSLMSRANGFTRDICNMLCKVLQTLPGELNPFLNANVQRYLEETPADGGAKFFDGLPDGATHRRCPNFANDTQGDRANSFPDTKLKAPELLRRLKLLLHAMQRASFPQTAPGSSAANVLSALLDDDDSAYEQPKATVLLRIPAAADRDRTSDDGSDAPQIELLASDSDDSDSDDELLMSDGVATELPQHDDYCDACSDEYDDCGGDCNSDDRHYPSPLDWSGGCEE